MFFIPIFIVFSLIVGVIIFPSESIESAKNGFRIWYDILIPSLLPFIIGANLLISLGIVDILGFIINPITSILFRVSGKGALIFVISMFSGYPVGTKLASEFRNRDKLSHFESQRLVSFCSTSGPLFIIGSVCTGMLVNESLGYLMLICHYIGAILVGIIFRNYGNDTLKNSNLTFSETIKNSIQKRSNNSKGFFVLFGESIFNGINTLLTVCGFVIIFAVVFRILSLFNIINLLSSILLLPLSIFGFEKEIVTAIVSGLFEITTGCNEVSKTASPEIIKASACSFLIGFSGLSILAQCCSFLSTSDIKVNLYIVSKFLHGIFASISTFILYPVFQRDISTFYGTQLFSTQSLSLYFNNFTDFVPFLIILYLLLLLIFINNRLIANKR